MAANNQLKPTQLRGTWFVLFSTNTSAAASVGLAKRWAHMKTSFILVISLWAGNVLAQGFAPGVVNHRPTEEEQTKSNNIKSEPVCRSKGGEWFEKKGWYAYCVLPYSDGGKICKNSKDCIGHCIAEVPKVGEMQKTDHGTCQVDDSQDDCGRPQIENGNVIYFNCD